LEALSGYGDATWKCLQKFYGERERERRAPFFMHIQRFYFGMLTEDICDRVYLQALFSSAYKSTLNVCMRISLKQWSLNMVYVYPWGGTGRHLKGGM
jgi:hypothetical protein